MTEKLGTAYIINDSTRAEKVLDELDDAGYTWGITILGVFDDRVSASHFPVNLLPYPYVIMAVSGNDKDLSYASLEEFLREANPEEWDINQTHHNQLGKAYIITDADFEKSTLRDLNRRYSWFDPEDKEPHSEDAVDFSPVTSEYTTYPYVLFVEPNTNYLEWMPLAEFVHEKDSHQWKIVIKQSTDEKSEIAKSDDTIPAGHHFDGAPKKIHSGDNSFKQVNGTYWLPKSILDALSTWRNDYIDHGQVSPIALHNLPINVIDWWTGNDKNLPKSDTTTRLRAIIEFATQGETSDKFHPVQEKWVVRSENKNASGRYNYMTFDKHGNMGMHELNQAKIFPSEDEAKKFQVPTTIAERLEDAPF